jgi:hypothetical protein
MNTYSPTIYWGHKVVTASILVVGASLNVAALIVGMDTVAATAFSIPGEIILTAWFLLALILGVLAEFRVPLAALWQRIVRRIVTFYMLMLTLAHGVNNLLLRNVEMYAKTFSGPLYTYTALVMLTALAIFILTLPEPSNTVAVA